MEMKNCNNIKAERLQLVPRLEGDTLKMSSLWLYLIELPVEHPAPFEEKRDRFIHILNLIFTNKYSYIEASIC